MKIAIACDHGGVDTKKYIAKILRAMGHKIKDFGTNSDKSCNYPDFAALASQSVVSGENEHAILICGTGIGMSIAANKVPGVRAALASCILTAKLAREHNNANVLCLGARMSSKELLLTLVMVWLNIPFEGGRHQQRLDIIKLMEKDPSYKPQQPHAEG